MTSNTQTSECGTSRQRRSAGWYAALVAISVVGSSLWAQADTSASPLIRSASGVGHSPAGSLRGFAWSLTPASLELTWNSQLPFSLNDGAQWAGRGLAIQASAGVRGSYKSLRVIVSPTFWFAQNQAFPILPGPASRSSFSSPFQVEGGLSADIPVRFGNERILAIDPGESAVWFTGARADVGFATESQWWGPGIRNAIVLSDNAGGFPHLFVRTARPITTRAGAVEAKWILGGLVESPFFDRDASNDLRSISSFVVTLSPAFQRTLTAGISRVVIDDAAGIGDVVARTFDALISGSTQINALFARWTLPASNAEIYGEWARLVLPSSLRDLLVAPQFTQGFTVGLQWLPRLTARSKLRMQVEMTNLEQSPESRAADTISFYTSRTVPQGFSHRGQVLGAAIGPGSSSQWLAFDYFRGPQSLGVFFGRIRWNTDAYYLTPQSEIGIFSYDASVFTGLRASRQVGKREFGAEFTFQRRYNFLFQNDSYGFSREPTFDKNNITVKLRTY